MSFILNKAMKLLFNNNHNYTHNKLSKKKGLVTKNFLALSAKLAIDSAKAILTTDSESFAMPLRDGKMYRLNRFVSTELKVSTTLSRARRVRTAVALTDGLLSFSKRTT